MVTIGCPEDCGRGTFSEAKSSRPDMTGILMSRKTGNVSSDEAKRVQAWHDGGACVEVVCPQRRESLQV